MPSVNVDVEVQVWCSCGNGLCRQATGGNGEITVEPCENCLTEKYDEGYDEGYAKCEKDNEV